MFEKLFGNVNEYKVSKFLSMLKGVFLFTIFSFLRIWSSVKHASLWTCRHITIFVFLHVRSTFNQDLFSAKSCYMSLVKPSHAFKFKSELHSTDFPWLCMNKCDAVCRDKVVHFTLEQTEKLSRSLRFVKKGNCRNGTYWSKWRFWCCFVRIKYLILFSTVNKSCWLLKTCAACSFSNWQLGKK